MGCGGGLESGGEIGFGLLWIGIDFAAGGVGRAGGKNQSEGKGEKFDWSSTGKPSTSAFSLPQFDARFHLLTLFPAPRMYSGVWPKQTICANVWNRRPTPTWER